MKRILRIAAVLLSTMTLLTASLTAEAAQRRAICSGGFFECLFGDVGVGSSKTRRTIKWPQASKYRPGSIIVSTRQRKLYYVIDKKRAIQYGVGVGRQGFQWSGTSRIVRKKKWPGWTPPKEMIRREKKRGRVLPAHMPGGPNNPLGARALYIGGTLYRIHGTNAEHTIGHAVSSGCIRMMNKDVIDLYKRARVGSKVYVR